MMMSERMKKSCAEVDKRVEFTVLAANTRTRRVEMFLIKCEIFYKMSATNLNYVLQDGYMVPQTKEFTLHARNCQGNEYLTRLKKFNDKSPHVSFRHRYIYVPFFRNSNESESDSDASTITSEKNNCTHNCTNDISDIQDADTDAHAADVCAEACADDDGCAEACAADDISDTQDADTDAHAANVCAEACADDDDGCAEACAGDDDGTGDIVVSTGDADSEHADTHDSSDTDEWQ